MSHGAPDGARRDRVDRGRGYRRVSATHVEVYDLDLAAWVHMHGVAIYEATRFGPELVVTFYDPSPENGDGEVDRYAIRWLNSEAAKFAGHVRQLKKIALSTGRYRPARPSR